MRTRVYVAGSSKEIELCRSYMSRLQTAGLEIAHDWPGVIDAHAGQANGDLADAHAVAKGNLQGVQRCDIFWLILPAEQPTIGAWVELGWALSRRRFTGAPRMVLSGKARDRSVFLAGIETYYEAHIEALQHVIKVGRELADSWTEG